MRNQDARLCFRPFARDANEPVQYIKDSIILPLEQGRSLFAGEVFDDGQHSGALSFQ